MDAHVSYQGQITPPNGALRKMSLRVREAEYCEKKEKDRDAVSSQGPTTPLASLAQVYFPGMPAQPQVHFPKLLCVIHQLNI